MTNSQADNLITNGRRALLRFIEAKDDFLAFLASFTNLEAATELTQEHFTGANEGLELATFLDAVQKQGAVLASAEVAAATKPVYKIGRQ